MADVEAGWQHTCLLMQFNVRADGGGQGQEVGVGEGGDADIIRHRIICQGDNRYGQTDVILDQMANESGRAAS